MGPQPPTPVCKAFLVCKQIFRDELTQECVLASPLHQTFAPRYPVVQDLAFFARWSNAHGCYRVELQLRDLDGGVLWREEMAEPFEVADPLAVVPLTLRHLHVRFPAPGKYEVALLANGQEVVADVFLAHLSEPTRPRADPLAGPHAAG
jgi:hypothetical protein